MHRSLAWVCENCRRQLEEVYANSPSLNVVENIKFSLNRRIQYWLKHFWWKKRVRWGVEGNDVLSFARIYLKHKNQQMHCGPHSKCIKFDTKTTCSGQKKLMQNERLNEYLLSFCVCKIINENKWWKWEVPFDPVCACISSWQRKQK